MTIITTRLSPMLGGIIGATIAILFTYVRDPTAISGRLLAWWRRARTEMNGAAPTPSRAASPAARVGAGIVGHSLPTGGDLTRDELTGSPLRAHPTASPLRTTDAWFTGQTCASPILSQREGTGGQLGRSTTITMIQTAAPLPTLLHTFSWYSTNGDLSDVRVCYIQLVSYITTQTVDVNINIYNTLNTIGRANEDDVWMHYVMHMFNLTAYHDASNEMLMAALKEYT